MRFTKKAAVTVAATMSLAISGTLCAQTAIALDTDQYVATSSSWITATAQAIGKIDDGGGSSETKKLGKEFLATVSSGDRLSTMSYEQLREEARKSVEKIGNGATLTENFEEGLATDKAYINPNIKMAFDVAQIRTAFNPNKGQKGSFSFYTPQFAGTDFGPKQIKDLASAYFDGGYKKVLETGASFWVPELGNILRLEKAVKDLNPSDVAKYTMLLVSDVLNRFSREASGPGSHIGIRLAALFVRALTDLIFPPPQVPSITDQLRDARNSAWTPAALQATIKALTTDLDKLWRSYQNSIVFDALQADAMIDAEYRNADNASGALAKEVADVKKDLHKKAQGALKESADRFRGDSRDMLVKAVRDKENFAEFSDNFMEANKESILKALQEVACKKANQGWDTRGSLASMTYVNCMKKGISNGDRLNFDKYEAEMHGDVPPNIDFFSEGGIISLLPRSSTPMGLLENLANSHVEFD